MSDEAASWSSRCLRHPRRAGGASAQTTPSSWCSAPAPRPAHRRRPAALDAPGPAAGHRQAPRPEGAGQGPWRRPCRRAGRGPRRRPPRHRLGTLAISRVRTGTSALTGGADVVVDCVGSAESIADALAIAPRGRWSCWPACRARVDRPHRPWHREIELLGPPWHRDAARRRSAAAPRPGFELVAEADLAAWCRPPPIPCAFRDAIEPPPAPAPAAP